MSIRAEERFTFVVAFLRDDGWAFHEYTPDEFMQMSYIPPFKIFFNVPVGGDRWLCHATVPALSRSVGDA